ncbi:MAG: hypothetical protein IPH08_04400 [Rhodocyclaceae bacterium]|nr:hypothetical protein [Rhodocyclaceae bacterium]
MTQLIIKSKTAAWVLSQSSNLLLQSTDFDTTPWVATTATLTGGQTDPTLGTDAFNVLATANNATVLQPITLTDGNNNRVFSIYIKRITGTGAISITAPDGSFVVTAITGVWTRYNATAIVSDSTVSIGVKLAVDTDEIAIYAAQYENGITPTTYAGTTSTPYTTTQIVDADYPANTCRGVVFLDGRFFVMNRIGEIYQSALEDALTWSALEFIQSQIDSSDGVYLTKMNNYVVAIKQRGIEFFYDAANPTGSILSPVSNAYLEMGCASENSVQTVGSYVVFLAQTSDGFGRSIQALSGTTAVPISTPNVEKILDQDDLAAVSSWTAKVGSHLLYGLTLGTIENTLVFDFSTKQWSLFTSLVISGSTFAGSILSGVLTFPSGEIVEDDIFEITGGSAAANGFHIATNSTDTTCQLQTTVTDYDGPVTIQLYTEGVFPVVASTRSGGRQYMQDATSGALYEFSQTAYTDTSAAIAARIRTPKLDGGDARRKTMGSAEVIGDKIDSVLSLRYTDDDYQTYSTFRPVQLGVERSRVRRLGDYSRRSFELLHLKNYLFRVEALEVN